MKKNITLLFLLAIASIVLVLYSPWSLNTYANEELGFKFTYPKKTYVYAVNKIGTSSIDIVFSIPDARETEMPLARISVTTHDEYRFPTRKSNETADNYPFEGFHKLTSEKIIKEDPVVIEFIWTDSEYPTSFYKEYRVVKSNRETVNYFDLQIGQGFTPEQLRDTALSFKFK